MADSPNGARGVHVTSHVISEYESELARAPTRYQPMAERTAWALPRKPSYAMLIRVLKTIGNLDDAVGTLGRLLRNVNEIFCENCFGLATN